MAEDVTAAQLANFDQTHSAIGESLDVVIDLYRASLAADEEPRELTMAGLGRWLLVNFESEAIAEHLVVAVDRMASPTTQEGKPTDG